jgi:hypothetical protein
MCCCYGDIVSAIVIGTIVPAILVDLAGGAVDDASCMLMILAAATKNIPPKPEPHASKPLHLTKASTAFMT